MRAPFFPVLIGLLLGAAAWFLIRPSVPAPIINHQSPIISDWSWRASPAPPHLAPDTARAAVTAWLALRAPDGAPADFATRVAALRALLLRLPGPGFPLLLQALSVRTGQDDHLLCDTAFDLWVERDPAAAARWSGIAPDGPGFDALGFARRAALAWARLDPAAATTWACTLPDEKRALDLAGLLLPTLAETDPTRALALASARSEAFLDKFLPVLVELAARTDPANAIRTYGSRLWKGGRGFYMQVPFRFALASWIAKDPAAAFAWMMAQPSPAVYAPSSLAQTLAVDNKIPRPVLANALVTVPGFPGRQAALDEVLAIWAASSPAEALAWLATVADPQLRAALTEQTSGMRFNDSSQALPFALAMTEGANRTGRIKTLLAEWAGRDPSAALAWIRSHDDPDVATAAAEAHAAILGNIAREEPATALAEWKNIPDGPTKIAAVRTIGKAWGRTDPTAAFAWMTGQEAGFQPDAFPYQALQTVYYAWSQQAPLAALRWAETQGERSQETYLYILSGAGMNSDGPPCAVITDLYAQLHDPALRTKFVTRQVRKWLTKDRPAAQAWLESHDALTPVQAAALLDQNPARKN